jgi:hypothetical protein
MEGNSAISDLSDPRRPHKISEMFSEIYDNQWTDAFECLGLEAKSGGVQNERVIIKRLLDIVMVCKYWLLTTNFLCLKISHFT